MKTSLAYLDERKRDELEIIVRMIREKFDVEMIILFGSYARGDAVEELGPNGVHFNYQSDFDLMVIVDDKKLAKKWRVWDKMVADIDRNVAVQTPVSIITDNIEHVNHNLRHGQYFYSDVKKEGILLYDSGQYELAEPKVMSAAERQQKAQKQFEYWYSRGCSFFRHYKLAFDQGEYEFAAFQLHQAVERFYSAILLVFTDYRAKIHDIEKLGKQAAAHVPKLPGVFPKGTEDDRRKFELLKNAYIDARYNLDYRIVKEELSWLAERVKLLQELTEKNCKQKIASFVN